MSYLLFAGDDHDPIGGADDLQGKFDTAQAAIAAHDPNKYKYDGGWANILCVDTLEIVMEFYHGKWKKRE